MKTSFVASRCVALTLVFAAVMHPQAGYMSPAEQAYPAESKGGSSRSRIDNAEFDEAMSGRTLNGTPISKRTEHCFPAEAQDVFWKMDQVVTNELLRPLNFDVDHDGNLSTKERDAI